MAGTTTETTGLKDPPTSPTVTYKNPRRTSPENSITLHHHRMTREVSRRNASMVAAAPQISITKSPRRNSSKESQNTGTSDPTRWFDQSNEHHDAVFDSGMDVDPPFFQKASESSNEEVVNYLGPHRGNSHFRPSLEHKSSSGDGFRGIIDDLTVENRRLRDELKKYKQMGPDSLRREKLFEVKVHGLPSRRKRELEAALRDFTTSLDGSSPGRGSQRKTKAKLQGLHSSVSKHASSTSGSNDRTGVAPPDSAYASNSTNQSSSDPSLAGKLSRQPSDQPVAQSLPDVPEGLWPRQFALTEAEKQKLVVRRLEQIFTGKGLGPSQQQSHLPLVPPAISEEVEMMTMDDQNPATRQATRQATILPHSRRKPSHSRDTGSASNSNEDQTDSRDQANTSAGGSGSGGSNEVSPPSDSQSEQRPTRPRDLDPDRPQVPAENMQYIRHLSDTGSEQHNPAMNGLLDADGWVYLNLLSNLAQLHMLNVTPSFIRNAVAMRSQKFQLSSDGHKIRWKGGAEGSKFSSDSSGASSQRETASEDTDGSNDLYQRKKRKTRDAAVQGGGGSGFSTAGPLPATSPAECFHYKPMFVHQQTSSSDEQPSTGGETPSSCGPFEESHLGVNSRWNNSGFSGLSQRKRRRDGAIIYYTGAPFCTDLSGDWGGLSPDSYACDEEASRRVDITGPELTRTASGSSIPFKPLSNLASHHAMMDLDFAPPESTPETSSDSEDLDADFPWSDSQESSATRLTNLEASGLGGVTPDDHFVVVVSTRRPKSPPGPLASDMGHPKTTEAGGEGSVRSPDSMVSRFARMPTSSSPPTEMFSPKTPPIGIEYVAGKVRRLPPAPLPPPTFFFLPSESLSEDEGSDFGSEDDISDEPASGNRRLVVVQPRAVMHDEDAIMSGEEDDDDVLEDDGSLDEEDASSTDPMGKVAHGVGELGIGLQDQGDTAVLGDMPKMTTGSSVATAGGMASDHSSLGRGSR